MFGCQIAICRHSVYMQRMYPYIHVPCSQFCPVGPRGKLLCWGGDYNENGENSVRVATNETWTRRKRVCMRVAVLKSAQRRIGKKIMQSCRTPSRITASSKRSSAQCARADSQRCYTGHTNDPYRSRALTCVWIASAIVLQPHMRHS